MLGKGVVNPKVGGAVIQGAPTGRKPRRPCSPPGPEEDKIQVLKVQRGGLTLPARVKERQYDRDDQWREAVPLLTGEGLMVVKRLTEGAPRVRKIIEFQKQRGKSHTAVELRKIMEATAETHWPQDVRVALGKKAAKIRKLGEAQGDKGLLQARGAAYTLLGGATPEWVANQKMRHRGEKDALRVPRDTMFPTSPEV